MDNFIKTRYQSFLYWLSYYDKPQVALDVLTPNGLLIQLVTSRESTFKEIKEEVFELAQKQPLYGELHDQSDYVFSCINIITSEQEIIDDDCQLHQIKPFFQLLKLIKKQGDKKEKQLNAKIGFLIGKGLHEFDALKNAEINNFRWCAREFSSNIELLRKNLSFVNFINYCFPPRLENDAKIPVYLEQKLKMNDNQVLIEFRFKTSKMFRTLKINCFECIQNVIDQAFEANKLIKKQSCLKYTLKINGRQEYLFGNYPLIQYTFVQESLADSRMLSFVIKPIEEIETINLEYNSLNENNNFNMQKFSNNKTISSFTSNSCTLVRQGKRIKPICIFDIKDYSGQDLDYRHTCKLELTLNSCIRVNCNENALIGVIIGVYYGKKLLCKKQSSNCAFVHNGCAHFEELVEFDIEIYNLPRMTRFSLMLYEVFVSKKRNETKKQNSLLTNLNLNHNLNMIKLDNLNSQFNANLLINPLNWVNFTLFDYKDFLRTGSITLPMWTYNNLNNTNQLNNSNLSIENLLQNLSKDENYGEDETLLNPSGAIFWNGNVENATCVTITFSTYSKFEEPIFYPNINKIFSYYYRLKETNCEYKNFELKNKSTYNSIENCLKQVGSTNSLNANQNMTINDKPNQINLINQAKQSNINNKKETEQLNDNQLLNNSKVNNNQVLYQGRKASKPYVEYLKEISDKDPLNDLTKQDKKLLWYLKDYCKIHLPNSLPHILVSLKWHLNEEVIEILALIEDWPLLSVEKGLELLDYTYCDPFIRRFAIKCLHQMTDKEFELYLLQMVQVLKFDSYLHSDLGDFLLSRAFQNQNLGHRFFWLLRSEMHEPSVSIKFGLLLEAYCRGAINHMCILIKQQETLNKFKEINKFILEEANKRKESRDKLKQMMKNTLNQIYYRDAFNDIINPLNPRQKLSKIKIENCKFMDSKMKPLWLVFSNEDIGADDTHIIFKYGDDLRQDMLTIQMLRIMDKIWKDEGLDLRFSFYDVIATDYKMGLIEVVRNATTIANIQKEKAFTSATSAFQKSSLLHWLKDQNPDEDQLLKAIDEFAKSCAGYCVATFVLGIADRHSDNIMLRTNGQLLHIDFGHILGKFKEKWKIRRERVPFVFTNDFAFVITNGNSMKKIAQNEQFQRFLAYCDNAFLILRRKGTFIIALFAIMLSTGFELSSSKDLDYLRETLVLSLNEQDAIKHFRKKFDESLRNSWKTSFNWLAHNISKDNN